MNPSVESALISAGAVIVSVSATATVAIASIRVSRAALDAAREGQIADRYSKAVEQLGSSMIDVTIGGIYALERIARRSPDDYHPTVMEVLAACIREHSREQWPRLQDESSAESPERTTRPDIQAALTVIGRRDATYDVQPIDLDGANLTRANLTRANLAQARFNNAVFTSANLVDAVLSNAYLVDADLTAARLTRANLTNTRLRLANLTGARLIEANLTGANLVRAVLADSVLTSANLTSARLDGANLTNAGLSGANLTGANLSGAILTGARLSKAQWSEDVPAPPGWVRDPSLGRLRSVNAEANDTGQ
jgi:hypothetical protein